ncbi:response regulator [Paenibacillus sp. OAS669]|uniref:response regulator n=1 Tax=Paenibacillus sp. OAS669 TaxID=2663821 RepID=UPI0017897E65|nr:response regulator [Paenibacillus sp. OAS669]MBE1440657.1 two-component system response regulator YesN [Paenibacillus sp. OAS669]
MWKLVIIDDDQIILRGLTGSIPWQRHGIEVAATAMDGEEGLEAVEKHRPHIVITDIRMPFMDGLEFTETVKANYPDTKIILMTSYDEFEFAQKALKLKVYDFVLKPVENDKLLEIALRAAEEWEQEQSLAKKVMEGIPFLKQRFYENLLRGKYKQEEIENELRFLELKLEGRVYTVILLIADDYFETGSKNRFGQELLKYCIQNVAMEVLASEAHNAGGVNSLVFEYMEDEIAIVYCSDEEEQTAERRALQTAELIRQHVETYLKTTITVGIGSMTTELSCIAGAYREAKAATEFRHLTGTNQVWTYRDTQIKSEESTVPAMAEGWEANLALKSKLGLEQEAMQILEAIEQDIVGKQPMTLERLRLLCIEIVFVIANAFQDWSEPPYAKEAVEEMFQELHQLRTAKEMFERIREFLAGITATVNDRRSRQQQQMVDQAIAFIQRHYMQEGLSLQDVADHVHLSTNYLSMIFKKEAGINFSDFLTETRMKNAIRLLRSEELKTYEVAQQVGYSNPQYFSVIFKKFTGKTPSEFKQSR